MEEKAEKQVEIETQTQAEQGLDLRIVVAILITISVVIGYAYALIVPQFKLVFYGVLAYSALIAFAISMGIGLKMQLPKGMSFLENVVVATCSAICISLGVALVVAVFYSPEYSYFGWLQLSAEASRFKHSFAAGFLAFVIHAVTLCFICLSEIEPDVDDSED